MSSTALALPLPLREGDRLTSDEFLRRWEALPQLKHAELIGGVVFFMPSPVSLSHGTLHHRLNGWIWLYADATPGCQAGIDGTWVMGPKDVPQPDIFLRILPECGGQSSEAGDYAAGAPELIVEVSGSSMSRDLGAKLDLYRRAGVREYLSVLLKPRQIVWRQLVRGRYVEIPADPDGLIRSRVFPGLWLHPDSIWKRSTPIRAAVEQGIESGEHSAFVRRLQRARKQGSRV